MEYCKKDNMQEDNMQEDNMQEDLIEAFNKHILEFIRDLQKVYPRDVDIQITKTAAHFERNPPVE